MELASNFVKLIQDVVLHPTWTSAIALLVTSTLNELVALLPYNVILSGQTLFLQDAPSLSIFIKLSIFVVVPISIGATLGSLPSYGLAYFGGKPAIDKFSKYLKFSWDSVERLKTKFKGTWYDEIIFLILRAVPFVPGLPVNILAGIIRMRPVPYLVLTLAGNIVDMLLLLIFFGFGAHWVTNLAQ